jgi:sulfatase maturation enzyme AslB (radical SAM superfamily)
MSLNYWLYRFKYRNAPKLKLKVPVDVSLELSAACNQRCSYCYWAKPSEVPFKKGFMNKEMAFKIISQAEHLGVNALKFNYRGESTMHPDFYKITSFAKSLAHGRTFIDRVTNSNFNFPNDRDDIFDGLCNQTKVKVSFDSFRKDVIESVRIGTKYELSLKNITDFYNYKTKNTMLVIQSVRTKLNADEDLEYEIKSRWPEAEVSIRDMVGGRVNSDLQALEYRKRDTSKRQSCLQAHARIIFTHEGRALPCCPNIKEDLAIGDINKNSIYEKSLITALLF